MKDEFVRDRIEKAKIRRQNYEAKKKASLERSGLLEHMFQNVFIVRRYFLSSFDEPLGLLGIVLRDGTNLTSIFWHVWQVQHISLFPFVWRTTKNTSILGFSHGVGTAVMTIVGRLTANFLFQHGDTSLQCGNSFHDAKALFAHPAIFA